MCAKKQHSRSAAWERTTRRYNALIVDIDVGYVDNSATAPSRREHCWGTIVSRDNSDHKCIIETHHDVTRLFAVSKDREFRENQNKYSTGP